MIRLFDEFALIMRRIFSAFSKIKWMHHKKNSSRLPRKPIRMTKKGINGGGNASQK